MLPPVDTDGLFHCPRLVHWEVSCSVSSTAAVRVPASWFVRNNRMDAKQYTTYCGVSEKVGQNHRRFCLKDTSRCKKGAVKIVHILVDCVADKVFCSRSKFWVWSEPNTEMSSSISSTEKIILSVPHTVRVCCVDISQVEPQEDAGSKKSSVEPFLPTHLLV